MLLQGLLPPLHQAKRTPAINLCLKDILAEASLPEMLSQQAPRTSVTNLVPERTYLPRFHCLKCFFQVLLPPLYQTTIDDERDADIISEVLCCYTQLCALMHHLLCCHAQTSPSRFSGLPCPLATGRADFHTTLSCFHIKNS